ncbi:MAG: sulfonate transport system substrate-binding protein [Caballeronia sp.]|nr:sulfonate transport system substrate-binding protein [Caballeronia sp.]
MKKRGLSLSLSGLWVAAAFALLPLSASAQDAASAPTKQLRIGFQKAGLLAVLKAQGSLEQKLKPLGYIVSWYEFPAGPQLLEALNTSNIDFGYTGAPPPIFAQAAGVNFVYVGAEPGGETNEALFVKANSPIHSPAELKGRRIALQKGSSSNFLLLAVLQKAGLKLDDIHPVYLPPADARAAFENGDVDAWIVWDPYYAAAQKALTVRTLADYTGLPKPFNFYEATRSFATQNPQAVRAVIEQLRTTGAWVTQHPADTAALLAPKIGLDEALVETWIRRVPYAATPIDEKIVTTQQSVADTFYRAKLIPKAVTVKDNVWQDQDALTAR